jgi:putative radical SAM enzyme (TIGR03279 family)
MPRKGGHRISRVEEGSIAADLGLRPGDRLLLLDGRPVVDIFDYELRLVARRLLLTMAQADGEIIEFDIEKDEDEDLGLVFAKPLLADCQTCANHCVFCFIDQMPIGLRRSLYLKDDDFRLSFLSGNYVTLTNLDAAGLRHLIDCRLSPVNVSVHATDPVLRSRMLRHKNAGGILEQLRAITGAGLHVNAQIVLCPGLNDGDHLTRTLSDLAGLGPAVQSIAIVPVGLTRYRAENGLFNLRPLHAGDARAVLAEVDRWQTRMLAERQTRLVYAADEIYLKAGCALPPVAEYEDLPQLENGVGMASLFVDELTGGLASSPAGQAEAPLHTAWPRRRVAGANLADAEADLPAGQPDAPADRSQPIDRRVPRVLLVSGMAAAPLLAPFAEPLSAWAGLQVGVAAISNEYFGPEVTVAGLLTGQDLMAQLPAALAHLAAPGQTHLVLPSCLLRTGKTVLLDGTSLQDIANALGVPVHVCGADASGLLATLAWLAERGTRRERPRGRTRAPERNAPV